MTDSTSNVARPRFGQGGRLYREEPAGPSGLDFAREVIEEARMAEMLTPDPPPWADEPEPIPEPEPPKEPREPKRSKLRKKKRDEPEPQREVQNPPHMKVGKIEAPAEPKPPFDRREAVSTLLELAGIGFLILTGFLIAVWVGTLIAGLSLVVLGVATSRNIGG